MTRAESGPSLVAASILTADFGNLYRVVRKLERAGVDRLHLDVMDGHFVPNLTFGPDVVGAFRRLTRLPLDVHLMISEPSRFVERFLEAGSDSLTFHVEVDEPDSTKRETLERIGRLGRKAGLAISPDTPVSAVEPFLDQLGLAMIMTVHPGFGGQRFIHEAAPKISEAKALLQGREGAEVHVDGGVNRDTASMCGGYGADVLVVGSALFQRGRDAREEVELVRRLAVEARESGSGHASEAQSVGAR
jgi:ribulose-phosphate 3-epimerase